MLLKQNEFPIPPDISAPKHAFLHDRVKKTVFVVDPEIKINTLAAKKKRLLQLIDSIIFSEE